MALDDWGNMFAPEELAAGNQGLSSAATAAKGEDGNTNPWVGSSSTASCSSSPRSPSTQHNHRGGASSPMAQFASKSSSSGSLRSMSISMIPTPATLSGDVSSQDDEGANRQSQQSLEIVVEDGAVATPIIESSNSSCKSTHVHKHQYLQQVSPQSQSRSDGRRASGESTAGGLVVGLASHPYIYMPQT